MASAKTNKRAAAKKKAAPAAKKKAAPAAKKKAAPVAKKKAAPVAKKKAAPVAKKPAKKLQPALSWQLPAGSPMVLVHVEAGPFTMGFAQSSDESPVHEHDLAAACYLGRDAVTWGQYGAFCTATGRALPEVPAWGRPEDHPVVGVTFAEAQAFASWAGLRLPTEPEWEKAARGPDGRLYPWGTEEPNDFGPNDLCVTWTHPIWGTNGLKTTAAVDAATPDVSPYGARHMVGNVGEWNADPYDPLVYRRYAEGDLAPPEDTAGARRVIRGSSYQGPARFARAACRINWIPDDRSAAFGFRIAISAATAAGDARGTRIAAPSATPGPRLPVAALINITATLEAGDAKKALAAARKLLKEAPALVGVHAVIIEALGQIGDQDDLIAAHRAAIAACPHNTDYRASAAEYLHSVGQSAAAADLLGEVIAMRGADPQLDLNHLIVLWSASRFADAGKAADALIAGGSEDATVRLIRALARFELAQLEGALEDLDVYLSSNGSDSAARNIRGDVLTALGRAAAAADAYLGALDLVEAGLKASPEDSELRGRRAYCLLALGRFPEALTDAEAAAALDPSDPLAQRSIGRARLLLGETDAAVRALERARQLAPDRAEVNFDLARALALAGRSAEARPLLADVSARSPRMAASARRDPAFADV